MDWANVVIIGTGVWQWMGESTTSIAAHIANSPTNCWPSIIHTASTCMGARSPFFPTAGFAPFAICWGWLLVGLGIGCIAVIFLFHHFQYYSPHVRRNIFSRSQPPSPLTAIPIRHTEWSENQTEFLQHLLEGGPELLQDLAQHSGRDPADIIRSILLPPPVNRTAMVLELLPPGPTTNVRPSRRY